MKFDTFTVVLLLRSASPPALDPLARERLQDAHMAYLSRLHDEGHVLAAGPFFTDAGAPMRGLGILRGSVEEVRRLAQQDPAVQAGWLEYQVLPWAVPAGAMTFSKVRFPASMAEAGA